MDGQIRQKPGSSTTSWTPPQRDRVWSYTDLTEDAHNITDIVTYRSLEERPLRYDQCYLTPQGNPIGASMHGLEVRVDAWKAQISTLLDAMANLPPERRRCLLIRPKMSPHSSQSKLPRSLFSFFLLPHFTNPPSKQLPQDISTTHGGRLG